MSEDFSIPFMQSPSPTAFFDSAAPGEELSAAQSEGTTHHDRHPERPVIPLHPHKALDDDEKQRRVVKGKENKLKEPSLAKDVAALAAARAEGVSVLAEKYCTSTKCINNMLGIPQLLKLKKTQVSIGNTLLSEYSKAVNKGR